MGGGADGATAWTTLPSSLLRGVRSTAVVSAGRWREPDPMGHRGACRGRVGLGGTGGHQGHRGNSEMGLQRGEGPAGPEAPQRRRPLRPLPAGGPGTETTVRAEASGLLEITPSGVALGALPPLAAMACGSRAVGVLSRAQPCLLPAGPHPWPAELMPPAGGRALRSHRCGLGAAGASAPFGGQRPQSLCLACPHTATPRLWHLRLRLLVEGMGCFPGPTRGQHVGGPPTRDRA